MTESNHRTRTFEWQDPVLSAQAVPQMSGLAFLQAIADGRLPQPPIAATLNYRLSSVSAGRVVFTGAPQEYHYNPIGTVHGGIAATLLDSAMACAVQTMLPQGAGYTTLEIKINYVRPILAGVGELQAIGEAIHVGRRVGTSEGRLVDAAGKLYAHGTTTCMIFPVG